MWSNVVFPPEARVPSSRSKHASVLHGQFLYLLGGRNGNVPLKDFWRYCISDNTWSLLDGDGDFPGSLQEHTMVGYRDSLYVFGGEVGFSNGVETPLWMYSISKNFWTKFRAPKGVVTPKGRRSHTATVFQDSMYIYGGYQDLKGSTSELWAFHFASETWHLVSQGGCFDCPPPRHRHSAVLHDNAMWIFGGMTDLQERSDFWRFDFVSRRWRPVKSKPGPGCLHSHCAVKFLSVMMLFGGEREGQTLSEVWRFHFATEFWERLNLVTSTKPMPRAQTTAFIFSQFTTRGAIHYMGLPEQDYFGSQPEVGKQPIAMVPLSTLPERKKYESCQEVGDEDDIYEEIDDFPKKLQHGGKENRGLYKFEPSDNCLADEEEEEEGALLTTGSKRVEKIYEQIPREILRDLRRPQHFRRLDDDSDHATSTSNSKSVNLKDLAKKSQLNLSRLSNYCGYSVFSNESSESLDTSAIESSLTGSPTSVVRLSIRKSRSGSLAATLTGKDSDSDRVNLMTRDPSSVPNFADLQLQTIPNDDADSQYENGRTEMTELSEIVDKKSSTSPPSNVVKRSDSDYTFQSYDCSSRSSTLSASINGKPPLPGQTTRLNGLSDVIKGPFEAIKLIDLEEEDGASTTAYFSSDEFSSLSGYESIEAGINNLNGIFNQNRFSGFSKPDDPLPDKQTNKMSFANPHYLCPEVRQIVEKRKGVTNVFGENMLAIAPASKDSADSSHQHFAQALNSPADSLFSDYQDFQARLSNDLVELSHLRQVTRKTGHPLPPLPSEGGRPKSALVLESSLTRHQEVVRLRNKELAEKLSAAKPSPISCTSTPLPGRKMRPVSTGGRVESIQSDLEVEHDRDENRNQLQLLMYIVGGREVGQVTVFKRPISMWKLDLTRTF